MEQPLPSVAAAPPVIQTPGQPEISAATAPLVEWARLEGERKRAEQTKLEQEGQAAERARPEEERRLIASEQRYSTLVGKQAAAYAAAGVDITSGSPLLMMAAEQARLEEERKRAEQARLEEERKRAEQSRLEQERQAAEQVQLEEERKLAEQARLGEERKRAEQAKFERERRLAAGAGGQQRIAQEGAGKALASDLGFLSKAPIWAKVAAAAIGILVVALIVYRVSSRQPSTEQATETQKQAAQSGTSSVAAGTARAETGGEAGTIRTLWTAGRAGGAKADGPATEPRVHLRRPRGGAVLGGRGERNHPALHGGRRRKLGGAEQRNDELALNSIFGSSDGTQLWAVGEAGTILHYTAQAGRWEAQSSGTTNHLESIFGSSDGAQLWAVGYSGTISHYTAQTGRWEAQSSGTTNHLASIFGSNDGGQLWAVGAGGIILHYTAQAGRWKAQRSGTTSPLLSIFGSSDGAQLRAVGGRGTILHYTAEAGRWEAQSSGTTNDLWSIFRSSDGVQSWAVGAGEPSCTTRRRPGAGRRRAAAPTPRYCPSPSSGNNRQYGREHFRRESGSPTVPAPAAVCAGLVQVDA